MWRSTTWFLIASLYLGLDLGRAAAITPEIALRVPAGETVEGLDLEVSKVIDYGSFQWVVSPASVAARLPASAPIELVGEVRLPGARFDPLGVGEPTSGPSGRALRTDGGTRQLRLIQLIGPPKSAWVDSWSGRGLEVVAYYPHFTYLVWADRAAVERVASEGYVRWHGLHQPHYAIDSELLAAMAAAGDRPGRLALLLDRDPGRDPGPGSYASLLVELGELGAEVFGLQRASADGRQILVQLIAPGHVVPKIAELSGAIWLGRGSEGIRLEDEMSDQIVAGNHPGGTPVVGYPAHLGSLGYDGSGVTWTVADTGVDWDHPDLEDRLVGGLTPPGAACSVPGQPGSDCPGGGHGTHVAGIVGADATAGFTDVDGFLYGLGVAPGVSLFAINVFSDIDFEEITQAALLGGSIGANNSWASGPAGAGYTAAARIQDQLVRDGDFDTAGVAEAFIQVFSAGNSGPGVSTITEPKEAKNIISVANSLNFRSGNINNLSSLSSRGPALDGRTLPTVTAPGSTIASTRNDTGGSCATAISGTSSLYAFCSGTSMAAPHVSGVLAIASEWWRDRNEGADFSPAMAKALLVNSATDMGTANIPNNNEGWGRVQVTRLVSPNVDVAYFDQGEILADSGQVWARTCALDDPSEPLKVSLAYTDAPGAAGANPALVNDLDLVVSNGSSVWRGNVFSSGWSTPGGSADRLNNLENVFVASPVAGAVRVVVHAATIAGDAVPLNGDPTDQDFALVCFNCGSCVDALIFTDGFESADTSAWSSVVP